MPSTSQQGCRLVLVAKLGGDPGHTQQVPLHCIVFLPCLLSELIVPTSQLSFP